MKAVHPLCAFGALAFFTSVVGAVGPIPVGPADITFQYTKIGGEVVTLQEQKLYNGSAGSQVPLDGNQGIQYFSSVNTFGRRLEIPGAVRDNESLLTHAFFKDVFTPQPGGIYEDFFADIDTTTDLVISVQNIQFAEPTWIAANTFLQHALWDANQADQVDPFYHHTHNAHTLTDPFRDFEDFFPIVFEDFPMPNYTVGLFGQTADVDITGQGTTNLGVSVTMPYEQLMHLEHMPDTTVPSNLPAPGGFLEPFHFHFEFVVVPEPTTLALLGAVVPLLMRRRR